MRQTCVGVTPGDSRGRVLRTGQTGDQLLGVILVIVIAAAIAFIGIDVTSEINDSIETDNQNFVDAQDNVSSGFVDAMALMDIVFIILIFTVILGALLAFRR